jgi:hypothetical protein
MFLFEKAPQDKMNETFHFQFNHKEKIDMTSLYPAFYQTYALVQQTYLYASSANSALRIAINPSIHLKSEKLTADQRERVNEIYKKKKLYSLNVPEIQQLYKDIKSIHYSFYALRKIRQLNGTYSEELDDTLKDIERCSKEALVELMFETIGISTMQSMADAYLEVNLKDNWRTERWWLEPMYRHIFTEDGFKQITHDKRAKFMQIHSYVREQVAQLCGKYTEEDEIIKLAANKSQKYANKAYTITKDIHSKAYDEMLSLPAVKNAYLRLQSLTEQLN